MIVQTHQAVLFDPSHLSQDLLVDTDEEYS